MKSNVDYVVCPECGALNAARWTPRGTKSYDVMCTECGYEYEHGHYESARNLTFEQFIREKQQSVMPEQDVMDFSVDYLFYLASRGDLSPLEVDCWRDEDNDE